MAVADISSESLTPRRLGFGLVALLTLVSLPSFYRHMAYFMTNQVTVIQGSWDLVVLNVVVFLAFAIPLAAGFRWRVNWQSASLGVYAAFVVSLFVEMYGVPLTIYVTSAAMPGGGGAPPSQTAWITFEFLGQTMVLTFWKLVGAGLVILGTLLIAWGWSTLYRTDEELVTSGIYAYSRHPQYLGFLLFLLGWFIHWPTLLTLAMFPVLAYFYYRLSIVEEREVMDSIGDPEAYREYIEETPRFI